MLAEAIFKESLAICEKRLGPESPRLLPILGNLADYYSKNGNKAEEEVYITRINALKAL